MTRLEGTILYYWHGLTLLYSSVGPAVSKRSTLVRLLLIVFVSVKQWMVVTGSKRIPALKEITMGSAVKLLGTWFYINGMLVAKNFSQACRGQTCLHGLEHSILAWQNFKQFFQLC